MIRVDEIKKENKMGIRFEFLKAGHGDSILISTTKGTNILIDGGVTDTYINEISYRVDMLDKLDLVVLTHIDNDHICGLIELINDKYSREKVNELWFNTPSDELTIQPNYNDDIGYGQGELFTQTLKNYGLFHRDNIYVEEKERHLISSDIELVLLSPMKKNLDDLNKQWDKNDVLRDCNGRKVEISGRTPLEDRREIDSLNDISFGKDSSYPNRSSIAFIMEYEKNQKFLLLGDADIRVVNESLKKLGYSKNNKLQIEFVKLSHHGSKNNINSEFLDLICSDTFIVLTDGLYPNSSTYKHPDKETLSLILNHSDRADFIKFNFNYTLPIDKNFPRDLKEESSYSFNANSQNVMEF